MNCITSPPPSRPCTFIRIVGVISISLALFLTFSPPVFAEAEKTGIEEAPSDPVISLDSLQKKIEETQVKLQQNKNLENEESAQQLGVTLDQIGEKGLRLQEIEGVYQQFQTAIKRQESLEKEKSRQKEQLQSKQETLIPQVPPYNLSFYDKFLHKYDVAVQKEEASRQYLHLAKKRLEESQIKFNQTSQNVRLLIDKDRSVDDNAEPSSKREWTIQMAVLEEELSKAQYDLEKIIVRNIETETNISEIERKVSQQQAEWIGSHLVYDEKDLMEKLKLFDGKKEEIKKRVAKLSQELQVAERGRLRAQKKFDNLDTDDEEAREKTTSLLATQKAWKGTYQKAIEYNEALLSLFPQAEQLWKNRYVILNEDMDIRQLEGWRKEALENLQKIDSQIIIEQNYRAQLQAEFPPLQFLVDSKKDRKKQFGALKKLSEINIEYLSSLQEVRWLNNRFLHEIGTQKKDIPFPERLKVWGKIISSKWDLELWVVDEHPVTTKKIILALLILAAGWWACKLISKFILWSLLRKTRLDESAAHAIDKAFYFIVFFILVIFSMKTVHIPLTALTFLGGAVAIGVGFGSQNLLNNFISGFILMIERPVKIGDTVDVDNNVGMIQKVGSRCTTILTGGNVNIIVPNSSLLEKNIINWTLSDRKIRCKVTVGVEYGSKSAEVTQLMLQAAADQNDVLQNPPPEVIFRDFGESSLIFDLYFWIRMEKQRGLMERARTESKVRFIIDELFQKNNIIIAIPQRDVHLATSHPLDVKIV
jgi:potassium-dependent mechanosensitive channel